MTHPTTGSPTRILNGLADVSERYSVLFCDLWGCYHNGVAPFPSAVAALKAFRAAGGAVILLTNAPRTHEAVRKHLAGMHADPESFDAIVASGDATRAAVAGGAFGRRAHIVGPDRDRPLWEGLDVERAGLGAADYILCTGLWDDTTETPDDYAELVAGGVARGLPFLCANPDIVVDRGETRLYCAGAIAERYAAAGGEVRYFGKPHAPIYALAMETAEALRPGVTAAAVLAIGDGIATDVLGAEQAGLDCVFISGGLAAPEVSSDPARPETPDPERLAAYLARHGRAPAYTLGRLG